MTRNRLKILALTLLSIGVVLGGFLGYSLAQQPTTTQWMTGGVYPGAPDFTVWKEDSNYFAKDEFGKLTFAGTDKHTIVQNCLDILSEGIIVIRGFNISYYSIAVPNDITIFEYYKGDIRKIFRDGGNTYALGEQDHILENRQSIPRWTTRGSLSNVYLHDSYLTLAMRNDIAGGTAGEVNFAGEFLYGVYQWRGKLKYAAPTAGDWDIYFGFYEEFASQYKDSIFIQYNGTNWMFRTRNNDNLEETEITGITWTNENTFKVNWTSTSVKFYINDTLKATHTTQVPTKAGICFLEIVSSDAATNHVYLMCRDWQEIT